MNEKMKQLWVEALRSGQFKQGQEYLYNDIDSSYCCLGVVAKVCLKIPKPYEEALDKYVPPAGRRACEYGVRREQELNALERDAIGLSLHHQEVLIRMNDTENRSFHQIADYIEEKL